MTHKLLLAIGVASALAFTSARAVLITDFGSDEFTPTFSDFTNASQTTSQITLDGIEGNQIFGDLSAPVNILGSTASLTITGIYTGSYNGQFGVEIYDVDGDSLLYTGFYSNFIPSASTTVNLTFAYQTGTFNGSVVSVGFTAGSSGGTTSVDLVASNLSAVPEPTSGAFLLCCAAFVAALRRRKSA